MSFLVIFEIETGTRNSNGIAGILGSDFFFFLKGSLSTDLIQGHQSEPQRFYRVVIFTYMHVITIHESRK